MKNFKLLTAVLGLAFLLTAGRAFAESVGTVTYLEGRVDRFVSKEQGYFPVVLGESVSLGDALRTKTYSKAEITLLDGSIVRLGDNTQVRISEYEVDQTGQRTKGVVNLERGKIRAIVSKADDKAPFRIKTPNADGAVKGSDLFVSYEKSATNVLVQEGVFKTFHPDFPDQTVEIGEGKASLVPYNAPPQTPRKYLPVEEEGYVSQTGPSVHQTRAELKDREVTRAVIVQLYGSVRVQPYRSGAWHVPALNEVLNPGDQIETGENGRIEISLDNGHVIELRPGSQLIINLLSRNPKTGEYKNLFESEFGRIRAKLQKVTKGSSFEIVSPTAVCGVRGTIMYQIITPTLTKAFFEGGDGYVTNRLTNVSKTIYAGMTASSDDKGKITDPVGTTGEERREFESDWGSDHSDSDEYGYSKPDGGDAGDDLDAPGTTGGGGNQGAGGGEENGNGEQPFNDVPPNEPGGNPQPPSAPESHPVSVGTSVSGSFGDYSTLLGEGGGSASSISAALAAQESENPWAGASVMKLQGSYDNAQGNSLWGGSVSGTGEDGGSLSGVVAGTWHSWEGLMAGLFIGPDGMAGTMQGYLSGDTDDENKTFEGGGMVISTPIEPTAISPADLGEAVVRHAVVEGNMTGPNGRYDVDVKSQRLNISGMDWGVWQAFYKGGYQNPDGLSQWTAQIGGREGEYGYSIGNLSGTDNLDGILQMNHSLYSMTPEEIIFYQGNVNGVYRANDSDLASFEGAGAGTWMTEPLSFTGLWGYPEGSLYYNNGGSMSLGGLERGVIGGIDSPWAAGSSEWQVMGSYDISEGAGPYLWHTKVGSYNLPADNSLTMDGGAFYGVTAGIWGDQASGTDGVLFGIYLDPARNAGLITSDLNGSIYPDIGMWMAAGNMQTEFVEQRLDVAPADFLRELDWDFYSGEHFDARFEGGSGSISGMSQECYAIALGGKDYGNFLWGIYSLKFGSENSFSNPSGSNSWSGYIWNEEWVEDHHSFDLYRLQGTWADGIIKGDLTGVELMKNRMSSVTGKFYGVYDETGDGGGTWIGTALAAYQDQWLTFNGVWGGGDGSDGALYVDRNGDMPQVGVSYGLIGAASSPWNGSANYLGLGRYSADAASNAAFLWNTTFESPRNHSTTPDGGAFWGYSAGILQNGEMDGKVVAFYIDPSGHGGYLRGDASGNYIEGIDMWKTEGTLTPTPMASAFPSASPSGTPFLPENLEELVKPEPKMVFNLSGDFDGQGGITGGGEGYARFMDNGSTRLPWGIINLTFGNGNAYVDRPEDSHQWSAVFGGSDVSSDMNYFIGKISEGSWENGRLSGKIEGTQLTDETLLTFNGDFLGIEKGAREPETGTYGGTWIGTGLGTITAEDLAFTGRWGMAPGTVYFNDGGNLAVAGTDFGLIGATVSPWDGPADFIAMGRYDVPEGVWPYMWSTRIESYNGPASGSNPAFARTTLDGGAFYGVTAGLVSANAFDGKIYAFYMDPSRNFGILKGEMAGSYYGDIELWKLEGTLEPIFSRPMPDVAPENFNSLIVKDPFHESEGTNFFADFGYPGSSIVSGRDTGNNYTIGPDGPGIMESLVDVQFGENNTFSNPQGATTWKGKYAEVGHDFAQLINIDGTWEDGLVRGTFSGKEIALDEDRLFMDSGDLYGAYATNEGGTSGTWSAVGIGYSTGEPLAITGVIDGSQGSLFYNDSGELVQCGTSYGLAATTISPWLGTPAPVTSIGKFETEVNSDAYVWMAPFYSYNVHTEKHVSLDGGAFYGWAAANWKDQNLTGFFTGIYIDPATNIGRFMREIDGDYVSDGGFWSAEGIFEGTGARKVINSGMAPADLYDSLEFTSMAMKGLFGGFGDGGNIESTWMVNAVNIDHENWGVWAAMLAGTYNQNASPAWQLPFSGFGIDAQVDGPYIMGTVVGTAWEQGGLSGTMAGIALGGIHFEDGHVYTTIDKVTGQVEGAYEIEGEQWQAVGAGEWVEVTELIDLTDLADLTAELSKVAQGVGLQISEVYSIKDLVGGGQFNAGGNLSAMMDVNLYGLSQTATEGIWGGIIHDGNYSGATGKDWALEFRNNADIIQLTGTRWENNLWSAGVTGTVAGNELVGQAKGTYQEVETGSGVFKGAAEGSWAAPAVPQ